MEQKRTIWIAVATGLFLLVVIGAALAIYAPKKNKFKTDEAAQATTSTPGQIQVVTKTGSDNFIFEPSSVTEENSEDIESNGDPTFGTLDKTTLADKESESSIDEKAAEKVTHTDNLTVIANGSVTINGTNPVSQAVQEATPSNVSQSITIDLGGTSSVRAANKKAQQEMEQVRSIKEEASPAKTITVTETKPAVQENTTSVKKPAVETKTATTASTTAKSTSTKTAATSTAKPAKKQALPDMFWVQVGTYSSKKNAEEARSTLSANRIECEMFTITGSTGSLLFRVRSGPYTSKEEAEYWKNNISKINMFKNVDTLIVNSSAKAVK